MSWTLKTRLMVAVAVASICAVGQARASVTESYALTAPGAELSTDGCGTNGATCTLDSLIPAGSTITQAFLYSSTYSSATNPNGVTLSQGANLTIPTFTPLGVVNWGGQAWRANVTSFVQMNANLGSLTTWTANEGAQTASIDGEALVIAFTNPAISTVQSVAVLDGFSNSTGDHSFVSFAPLPSGFTAAMQIGDGFSYDGPDPNNPSSSSQVSTITVNGNPLTTVAGHCDDDQTSPCLNGSLITMGAVNAGPDNDPFTPYPSPTVGEDHENYNLANVLSAGNTVADIDTVNPSDNDNIFLETFEFSVAATVTKTPPPPSVPEPGSLGLLATALTGLGLLRRRKRPVG